MLIIDGHLGLLIAGLQYITSPIYRERFLQVI